MATPNWKRIAKEYITGDVSMNELAKKHGVGLRTVKVHSANEHWRARREEYRIKAATKAGRAPEYAPSASDPAPTENDVAKVEKVFLATELLIDRVIEVLEKEKYLDGRELSSLATAIGKAKEIKNIRDALDEREQRARIANLEQQTEKAAREPVEIAFANAEEASR